MATGFFDRLRGVFRVHADRTISRLETPDVLAAQSVQASKANRDQVYRQLVASKAAEVEARQRAAKAVTEAKVYRERATARLGRGDRDGAEVAMREALQREQMAAKLNADCEQAGRVNAELSLSLARLDTEVADIGMQAVISTSRYRQAQAINGVAEARYGDPAHPRRGAREMLRSADERTGSIAAQGQAVWEIGQSLPNAEFDVEDVDSQVAFELDAIAARNESALGTGESGSSVAGASAAADVAGPADSAISADPAGSSDPVGSADPASPAS